jgi:glucose-1-phosphate cytidylyltransferase
MEVHHKKAEPWKVTLVDTGEATMTGGRLKRVREYLDDTFCFTYGDGVADVDVTGPDRPPPLAKAAGHGHGRAAPRPLWSAGLDGFQCEGFQEKPEGDGGWINGGFFVLEPSVIDRIEGDACIWEQEPLNTLASENGPAHGLPPSRLLAADGHPARPPEAGGALGSGRGPLEGVVMQC